VSSAWQFYVATLLVYTFVYILAATGLNLQFGVTGINNFAFVVFSACGAYTTAVLTLGKSTKSFQHYILGFSLPFPIALIVSGIVSGALGLLVGLLTVRRLRADYLAIVMLVISLIATALTTDITGLFNGAQGLALIPQPFASVTSSTDVYNWLYVGFSGLVCLAVALAVKRVIGSPLGRSLRAVRENEAAAAALGKNVVSLKLAMFAAGGCIAGLSGSVLVGFIQAWSPSSWLYGETFVLFTALIIGGAGSNLGPIIGAVIVPVGLAEGTRFLPQIGSPTLMPSLEWIVIGVMLLVFLWFWPRGIVPEQKRTFPRAPRVVAREPAGLQPADGELQRDAVAVPETSPS
jgi:branched-chain amino acid transport system permease protein